MLVKPANDLGIMFYDDGSFGLLFLFTQIMQLALIFLII